MLRLLPFIIAFALSFSPLALAEERPTVKQTHVHFEDGVVYCDVQTFDQESYVLKVLGGGSPLTIYWQFDVLEQRDYWPDSSIALIRLGKQVIPDLVTKRWLMRDLSAGMVQYTSDVRAAMRFLTAMDGAAVVDTSILNPQSTYQIETKLYMYEGEQEELGWWSSLGNWGEDMGDVTFKAPINGENIE